MDRILAAIPKPAQEIVSLREADRRVLAETVLSPCDLPIFNNSAMDGYAVRTADVAPAKADFPVRLRLSGRIVAGQAVNDELMTGTCFRVFTGSALPHGTDAVIMQEDTRWDPANPEEVLILEAPKPWENVRLRGEDLRLGASLVEEGVLLTAGRISLLAAAGVPRIKVGRQPIIGILATGSELREPGEPLGAGQIYESNRLGLASLVRAAGAIPNAFPLVADSFAGVQGALEAAFSSCDAVVTSGGVSVGELDFVKSAFEGLGGDLRFWRVAIKPGRPFVFGRYGEKFLFGLPGNPISALVTFLLLVRPALLHWQGRADLSLPAHPGKLAANLDNHGPRRHFMRVKVDNDGNVFPAGFQASHVLSSFAAANGLVDVPPATNLLAGTTVRVKRWEL